MRRLINRRLWIIMRRGKKMKFVVNRQERILDDMDMAILIVDQQGGILFVNNKAQEWYKEWGTFKNLSDFHETLNQKPFKAEDVYILPIQTLDGLNTYFRLRFVSHYGEKSRNHDELFVFVEDITEMRKEELFKDKLLFTISQMYEMKDTQMLLAYLVEQFKPFF
jgi:PAS domain-containing protein